MTRTFGTVVASAFVLLGLVAPAAASDAVQAAVSIPAGQPVPLITETGTGATPGTFARGTITLDYVVVDTVFPTGTFASFNLDLDVLSGKDNGQATAYPVALHLTDIGSPNVNMSAAVNPLSITSAAWSGSTLMTIAVDADPSLNVDGAEIVGNLRLETPPGSHMDTVTTIKVRIRLVHPGANACIRLFNFITDTTLENTYTAIDVNVNNQGKVSSTNPGQLSDNLLVVNTCPSAQGFDVRAALDSRFSTSPSNNPGNAVFSYFSETELLPSTLTLASFGAGTAQGQNLCLSNVIVGPGASFLMAVKMSTVKNLNASQLPGSGQFSFSGVLYDAGTGCSGLPNPLATPNPVSAFLGFTVK